MTDFTPIAAVIDPGLWVCPDCRGPWLQNLDFAHTAACAIGEAERATFKKDAEKLRGIGRLTRPTTDAERDLCWRVFNNDPVDVAEYHAEGMEPPMGTPGQTVVTLEGDRHHRTIGRSSFDPDTIETN